MKTKFFTGEGDKGESKIGQNKVSKSSPVVELLGSLDELNSWIGFCRVEAEKVRGEKNLKLPEILKIIQNFLFVAQAEIAALGFGYPKAPKITNEQTIYCEAIIREIDKTLPKLEKFVLVGGSELSARLDVGRAIARRVERQVKSYSPADESKNPSPEFLKFLNRLSSVLFALARYGNFILGFREEHPKY